MEGLATNGTDIWIVDARQDKVYKYTGAASRLSGSQTAASSFNLNSGNTNGKGIVTDGTSLWVVDAGSTNKVFKYSLAGTLLGSWTIDAANASPTGLTINPASVSDIWIVDNGTDRVYQYTAAAGRTSGSQSASATFALAAGNTNPQDIADPPPPDTTLTPATSFNDLKQTAVPAFHLPAPGGVPIVAALPSLADRDAVFALLARESFSRTGGAFTPSLGRPAPIADRAFTPAGPSGGQEPVGHLLPLAPGSDQRFRSQHNAAGLLESALDDEAWITIS